MISQRWCGLSDFFEIDFLDVEAKKSGDAIAIRYQINGTTRIHVTDGGFQATGDTLVDCIDRHYVTHLRPAYRVEGATVASRAAEVRLAEVVGSSV